MSGYQQCVGNGSKSGAFGSGRKTSILKWAIKQEHNKTFQSNFIFIFVTNINALECLICLRFVYISQLEKEYYTIALIAIHTN